MQELMPKELAETVPPMYATEEEDDPIARVKLFSRAWTWYDGAAAVRDRG